MFLTKCKQRRRIPFRNGLPFIVKMYQNQMLMSLRDMPLFHEYVRAFLHTYLVIKGNYFRLGTSSPLDPQSTVPVFLLVLIPVTLPAAESAQL